MERINVGDYDPIILQVLNIAEFENEKEREGLKYIDESKAIYKGKKIVEKVELYFPVKDVNGNDTSVFNKISIDKRILDNINSKISEIESITTLSSHDNYSFY